MAKPPVTARISRLHVLKTYKLYVGGAFIRSESGKVLPALTVDGRQTLAQVARASRKDLRDAVGAARKVFPRWSSASEIG